MSGLRYIVAAMIGVNAITTFAGPLEHDGWLAFGDLRGYVEPCGCDPEADLGGIQRQSVMLQRERALRPGLFLFNLGNNLPIHPKDEPHKIPILLKALAALKPDAVLFGRLESKGYAFGAELFGKLPVVASNLKSPSKYGLVKDFVSVRGVFVAGFVEPQSDGQEQTFLPYTAKQLEHWQIEGKKSKQKVLLFDGSEELLRQIHSAGFFNLIVSSNQRSFDKVVGPEEKDNPRLLERLNGKVRMVPVGGQGFLRGGALLEQKAETLENLLGKTDCKSSTLPSGLFTSCPDPSSVSTLPMAKGESVTWLTREYAVPSPLDALYQQYQHASAKMFDKKAKDRVKDLGTTPFAGSAACKSCHPQAYKIWESSPHARALHTLEKISKDKDPECVGCHVLGYNTKGGFVNRELSPQFSHVNCENCHGPRKEHSLNPAKPHPWKNKSKEICTSCHHGTHTSNFKFDEYWPRISHGPKSE